MEKHAPEPANDPLIADAMNVYATEAAPHLKTAKKIAYHIDSVLAWWGTKTASEVTAKNCRAYAATKRPQMARADINVLKWALTYWHNDSDYGPLSIIPTYWRPDRNRPRERWLTRSEAARLLGRRGAASTSAASSCSVSTPARGLVSCWRCGGIRSISPLDSCRGCP